MDSRPLSQSLFGRRKVRQLRTYRQGLMDELLPEIAIENEVKPFGDYKNYILEIGFGAGEHLANMAKNSSNTGFIGAEVFINGIASLLAEIDKNNLQNIRIFSDDARQLLPLIPDNFLQSIYLLFPDPWHKKRHAKRRLLQKETLHEFHRILKPKGDFFIASDNVMYIRHALHVMHDKRFSWQANKPSDWQTPFENHTQTRFESKALRQNRKPVFLHYLASAE